MKTIKIYSLSSSNNPENIRYIGKTISKLHKRFSGHKQTALKHKENSYLYNWYRKELENGNKIIMSLIDEIPMNEYNNHETYWISKYKELGFNLVNYKSGDENKYLPDRQINFSEDVLENIRKAAKLRKGEGRLENPNAINRIKESRKNITLDSINKAKITRNITLSKKKEIYGTSFPKLKLKVEYSSGEIEIYDSISDASKKLNINYNTLYTSIKKERNLRRKYKFSLIL